MMPEKTRMQKIRGSGVNEPLGAERRVQSNRPRIGVNRGFPLAQGQEGVAEPLIGGRMAAVQADRRFKIGARSLELLFCPGGREVCAAQKPFAAAVDISGCILRVRPDDFAAGVDADRPDGDAAALKHVLRRRAIAGERQNYCCKSRQKSRGMRGRGRRN